MSARVPVEEFRSLTTLGKVKLALGWAVVAFLLVLGIAGSLGIVAGLVLGLLFATLGAVLWIGGFA